MNPIRDSFASRELGKMSCFKNDHLFIRSFHKYLLNSNHRSGTLLKARDRMANNKKKRLQSLTSWDLRTYRERDLNK